MKLTILILLTLSTIVRLQAQQVTYAYDAAGNRISRTIIMQQQARERNQPEENTSHTDKLGEASVTIYPNPTQGLLKVNIDNMPEDSQGRIQVFDLNGQMLMQKTDIDYSTDVDLSSQSPGTYILKITLSDKTTTWKIIKQ